MSDRRDGFDDVRYGVYQARLVTAVHLRLRTSTMGDQQPPPAALVERFPGMADDDATVNWAMADRAGCSDADVEG